MFIDLVFVFFLDFFLDCFLDFYGLPVPIFLLSLSSLCLILFWGSVSTLGSSAFAHVYVNFGLCL